MREQEFKARDKTVNKMSRDGLVEENLQKKDSVRISQRELDNLTLPGQAADSVNFQREKAYSIGRGQKDSISSSAENPSKASRQQRQSAKKRRLYEAHTKNPLSEQAGDPLSGLPVQPENHTYFAQEPDGNGDTEPEIPETE